MTTGVPAGFGLGVDFGLVSVPVGVDFDPLEGKLDLFDAECSQLAESEPGVHRGRPQRLMALLRRRDKPMRRGSEAVGARIRATARSVRSSSASGCALPVSDTGSHAAAAIPAPTRRQVSARPSPGTCSRQKQGAALDVQVLVALPVQPSTDWPGSAPNPRQFNRGSCGFRR